MKIGIPVFLSVFLVAAGNLHPEESFFIGISREQLDPRIVFLSFEEGSWREEDFAPAERFDGNFSPALAVDPSGEVWVAWAARRAGEKPKIFFSRRRGGSWTEPRRVSVDEESWEMTPAIAFGADGTLLAAWSGERDDDSEIYCARWEGGGFGPPERVSSPGRSPNLYPALAVSPAGRAVLVWQGWGGGRYRVWTSFYDGREWSAAGPVARRTGSDQVYPFAFSRGENDWECRWVERGELFAAVGGERGWAGLTSSQTSPVPSFPRRGEPPLDGWALERDRNGKTRTGRVGVTFNPVPEIPARAAAAGIGNREFIGYGDSITYGTDGPPMGKCYIPLLQDSLEAAYAQSYSIYNHGYPGCNTLQLLNGGGYPIRVCPGIESVVSSYNASHILIMAGTNDYDKYSPATTKTHLGAMVDRARNLGCEPVLATIIPVKDNLARYNWNQNLNYDYIAPLAREKSCRLADPFQAYLDYGAWQNLLVSDGIHPVWTEGSRVIADAWFSALYTPPLLDSGDYDGDGSSDIAVFRPAAGLWAVRGITRVYFGEASDIPVSGDYGNDGTTDIAVFRESTGLWLVSGVTRVYFGRTGDIPVPGDYGGDGLCQPAVFRAAAGLWAVRGWTRCYFGGPGDRPAPGYYRGSRRKDIAVFRPASGLWAIRGWSRSYFGRNGDQPVPSDFAGDGADRAAVFRPASGLWAARGTSRFYYGGSADRAQPAPYGGGAAVGTVFRESSGLWAQRGLSRIYFGTAGDIPLGGRVPRPITPVPSPSPTPHT